MPPELNDLWFLTREMGFWLHVTGPDTTWAVAGSVPLNTQVAAYVDWNMVGYPYFDNPVMTALEFKDMVESHNPTVSVLSMEVGDQSAPYGQRPIEDWEEMQHGKGYWVQLDGDGTIEFTNILSKSYFIDEINRNVELIQEMDAPPAAETKLDKAETELGSAIEGFEEDVVEWALVKMRRAVGHLMEAEDRGADCGMIIQNVYGLARTIADIAIEDAIEVAGEEDAHVLKAQEHYSSSVEMQENGMYEKAVKELRKAYREAIKAL
jgi:hypothetical protein